MVVPLPTHQDTVREDLCCMTLLRLFLSYYDSFQELTLNSYLKVTFYDFIIIFLIGIASLS